MHADAPRALAWRDFLAVTLVAAIPLLLRVQVPPVYWWDEARVALNALEMMTTANPLVVTYNGEADLWNTKPPLAIWLSALSMRQFGVHELALRLPTLLAAMATVLAVFAFTHRVSSSRAIAWVAAMFLLGTGGYVEVHVARTADFDALLIMFVTLATFSLFGRWNFTRASCGAAGARYVWSDPITSVSRGRGSSAAAHRRAPPIATFAWRQ